MKIIIATLGSIGDLLPFLVVGTALRDRGHHVVFASNGNYESLVRTAGFEFTAIWERTALHQSLDEALERDPEEAWRIVQRELFETATKRTFDFIQENARGEKCTVLAPWSAFGAKLAHENLDVPLCSAYLSPHAFSAAAERAPLSSERTLSSAERSIAFFPAWFCPPQPDWPPQVELTGFPMFDDASLPAAPEKLERFLADGERPVVFTPGTFMRGAAQFFRASLAACTTMNLRAVFLTPYAAQIPSSLPSTVIHLKYVPLQTLLGRAAALVYHGGIGTCAQALKAGIPHLVAPNFFDQFDNGNRVESMGVGRVISATRYTEADAAEKLGELLYSGTMKRKCAQLRDTFKIENPVRNICKIIETMA